MAMLHYTAKVKESRLLELPEEAQGLGLKPGEEVKISVERNGIQESFLVTSSEQGLDILRQIAERHKDRRITDSSTTQRLLNEARGGAAYGYEPTE